MFFLTKYLKRRKLRRLEFELAEAKSSFAVHKQVMSIPVASSMRVRMGGGPNREYFETWIRELEDKIQLLQNALSKVAK